jgi:hypothetical protein
MRNCQESARGKKDGKGIGWAEILEQSLFQFPQSPISFLYWESMRNQELRVSNWAHCIMDRDLGVSNWVQCIMDETIYMLSPYLLSWLFKHHQPGSFFFPDLSTTSALVAKTPEALSWQKLQQEVSLIGFLHCCIDSIWYFCGIWTGEVGWNFFFCK